MSEKILILHSLLSGLDILTAIILLVAVLSGLATGLVVKLGQIVAVIGSYVSLQCWHPMSVRQRDCFCSGIYCVVYYLSLFGAGASACR